MNDNIKNETENYEHTEELIPCALYEQTNNCMNEHEHNEYFDHGSTS